MLCAMFLCIGSRTIRLSALRDEMFERLFCVLSFVFATFYAVQTSPRRFIGQCELGTSPSGNHDNPFTKMTLHFYVFLSLKQGHELSL